MEAWAAPAASRITGRRLGGWGEAYSDVPPPQPCLTFQPLCFMRALSPPDSGNANERCGVPIRPATGVNWLSILFWGGWPVMGIYAARARFLLCYSHTTHPFDYLSFAFTLVLLRDI